MGADCDAIVKKIREKNAKKIGEKNASSNDSKVLDQSDFKCLRENKAATTIQAFWRCQSLRIKFSTLKNKTILIQSYFRMQRALKEYKIISDQRQVAAILIQSWVRRFLAQCKLHSTAQQTAAIMIQAFWRCQSLKIKFSTLKNKTVLIQSYARMWSAMETYKINLAVHKRENLQREKAATTIQVKICTKYRKHCKSYVSFHQIGLFLSKAKV